MHSVQLSPLVQLSLLVIYDFSNYVSGPSRQFPRHPVYIGMTTVLTTTSSLISSVPPPFKFSETDHHHMVHYSLHPFLGIVSVYKITPPYCGGKDWHPFVAGRQTDLINIELDLYI